MGLRRRTLDLADSTVFCSHPDGSRPGAGAHFFELPNKIRLFSGAVLALSREWVCFSIEPGPLGYRAQRIDSNLKIEIRLGPDRRRSGPHLLPRIHSLSQQLTTFRGGGPGSVPKHNPTSARAPTSRVPRWCFDPARLGKNLVHLKETPVGGRRGFRSGRSGGLGDVGSSLRWRQFHHS